MNDLLDELLLDRPGARATPTAAVYSRDLTDGDLQRLADTPRGTVPQSLLRIHASHHALARCLATGMKTYDAGLVTGYSPQRISQLERDPLFIDLVEGYRREATTVVGDIVAQMQNISLAALALLQERLEHSPEDFSVPLLLETAKTFADRTGHGPNAQVNLNIGGALGAIDRPPRETYEEWEARRQGRPQLTLVKNDG